MNLTINCKLTLLPYLSGLCPCPSPLSCFKCFPHRFPSNLFTPASLSFFLFLNYLLYFSFLIPSLLLLYLSVLYTLVFLFIPLLSLNVAFLTTSSTPSPCSTYFFPSLSFFPWLFIFLYFTPVLLLISLYFSVLNLPFFLFPMSHSPLYIFFLRYSFRYLSEAFWNTIFVSQIA